MNCIICGKPMRLFGIDYNDVKIHRCDECIMIQSPQKDLSMYDENYFDGMEYNKEFDFDRYGEDRYAEVYQYLQAIKDYTKGTSLLDVGTGNGLVPYIANKNGYHAEATDVSKYVCDILPEKGGFPVYYGQIEDIAFPHKYDVITLFNVLEHTINPVSTLEKCKEILNDNGFVIVQVPNYLSLNCRSKDFLSKIGLKSRPFRHLDCDHHNFVFSLNSLKRLGEKTGFKVTHQCVNKGAWKTTLMHRVIEKLGLSGAILTIYQK